MGIENLKRWHWMIIGGVLGCILAGAQIYFQETILNFFTHKNFSQQEFENVVESRLAGVGPLAQNVKVHHVYTGGYLVTFDVAKAYPLIIPSGQVPIGKARQIKLPPGRRIDDFSETTFGILRVPGESYVPWSVRRSTASQPAAAANATVVTYLQKFPDLDWKVPWTEKSHLGSVAWVLGSIVVVGVIWPEILALMIKFGLHPAPKHKDTYELSRFKSETEAPKKTAAEMTQSDLDQLEALEAELEKNLAAGASPRAATIATATTAAPAIRKLEGAAAKSKPAAPVAAPDKAFGATQTDFYPTEVHGKKKD